MLVKNRLVGLKIGLAVNMLGFMVCRTRVILNMAFTVEELIVLIINYKPIQSSYLVLDEKLELL